MKKNCLLICSILTLSLLGMGCSKSGKIGQRSTFSPPNGPMVLKIKWTKGERIDQSMVLTQTMVMTVPGVPTPMEQNTTMGQDFGFTVLDETPDGKHEVEMDFLNAKMTSAMGGKTMVDYDSSKKAAAGAAPDPVGDLLGKVIGSKVQFYLDATNGVERITGTDELTSRLSAGNQQDQLAMMRSMYSEGYLKQTMSAYQILSPNPVQPGDTWPVHFEFTMDKIGTLIVDNTFTFQNWEIHGKRYCARLEFQGTIKSSENADIDSKGMSFKILDGTASGSSWFDPELGVTLDTTMNQTINSVITVPKPGGRPGDAGQTLSIPAQMTQSYIVKLNSVK